MKIVSFLNILMFVFAISISFPACAEQRQTVFESQKKLISKTSEDEAKVASIEKEKQILEDRIEERKSVEINEINYTRLVSLADSWIDSDEASKSRYEDKLIDIIDKLKITELNNAVDKYEDYQYLTGLIEYRLAALFEHTRDLDSARIHYTKVAAIEPPHFLFKKATQKLNRLDSYTNENINKIGVLLPLSGKYKAIGLRLKQSIELGAKIATGKSGDKLEFVILDTAGDPLKTVKQIETLVFKHHVGGIIGPLTGDTATVAASTAENLEVPIIVLSARDSLPETGKYVFRSAMTIEMQVREIVKYAWDVLGKRKFAIMYPQHDYGKSMAFAFWDEVLKRGGEIKGVERYRHDQTTFKREIRRMVGRYIMISTDENGRTCRDKSGLSCTKISTFFDKDKKDENEVEEIRPIVDFEALFIPDYAKQAGMLAPAIPFEEVELDTKTRSANRRMARNRRRMKEEINPVQLLGTNGWNQKRLIRFGGKWVEGSIFCDGFYALDESNLIVSAFVKNFKSDYNRLPTSLDAYAFDAVGVMSTLIMESDTMSRENLRNKLSALEDYEGATGHFKFLKNGEMSNELIILTVSKKEIVPAAMTLQVEGEEKKMENLYSNPNEMKP